MHLSNLHLPCQKEEIGRAPFNCALDLGERLQLEKESNFILAHEAGAGQWSGQPPLPIHYYAGLLSLWRNAKPD